ncbi:sulfotransferase [Demequina gelatinilytica]|uniref:sulfotransferase n=1 Tax=Demequina gelatinilytica TaxID=1638980 RepID=UPI000784CD49|nr:sulfotransferase [Demequina gelatinilytica]
MARAHRTILVTGVPRSGTTPIGEVLGFAPSTRFLYEPLNYESGLRSIEAYFPTVGDTRDHDEDIQAILDLRLRLRSGVFPEDRGLRRLGKYVVGGQSRVSARALRWGPTPDHVIWKDPFAIFLVARIATRFAVPTVITMRDPHAVAASFKRLGWSFDIRGIQRRLDPGGDAPWALSEDALTLAESGSAATGAALWRLGYGHASATTAGLANIAWVSVEDVLEQPRAVYERLYEFCGLELSEDAVRALEDKYRAGGRETPTRTHDRHRDVGAVATYWHGSLTEEENAAVDALTADVRVGVPASRSGLP